MHHLFLSPHPDDAVLSAGGTIYQLVQSGESVEIFTLMSGEMPAGLQVSPFIQEHLDRWGLGSDPVPGRRAEDRAAAERLGAAVTPGPFADALYRVDRVGRLLYPDLGTLFSPPEPNDPVLNALVDTIPVADMPTMVYAPMGAGHHVDHLLVRDAVRAWHARYPRVAVSFYEEYPYSADRPDVVDVALRALWTPVDSAIVTLSEDEMQAKIEAIACHQSQISTFWEGLESMSAAVRAYARQVGGAVFAERFWHLVRTP